VGVVQQPVEQADSGGVLGQEPAPLNWNWLRFLIDDLSFDLGTCACGAPA
jgi:hypothetical protein